MGAGIPDMGFIQCASIVLLSCTGLEGSQFTSGGFRVPFLG